MTLHRKDRLHLALHSEMDDNGIRGYWEEIPFYKQKGASSMYVILGHHGYLFSSLCAMCPVQYALLCPLLLHSTHRSSDLRAMCLLETQTSFFFFLEKSFKLEGNGERKGKKEAKNKGDKQKVLENLRTEGLSCLIIGRWFWNLQVQLEQTMSMGRVVL